MKRYLCYWLVQSVTLSFVTCLLIPLINGNLESVPKIVQPPESVAVTLRNRGVFLCSASGRPPPKISWSLADSFTLEPRWNVVSGPGPNTENGEPVVVSSLTLTNALLRDDQVEVLCKAVNVLGQGVSKANIKIFKSDAEVPTGFPRFINQFSVIVKKKNMNVTLECQAEGNPKPTILWLKDSLPVDLAHSRITQLQSGNLHIERTHESDEGKYVCIATNSHGSLVSPESNLMVRENVVSILQELMQTAQKMQPHILSPLEDVQVEPGATVDLVCNAVGDPLPVVLWFQGTTNIPSVDTTPGTAKIVLSDVTDSRRYTCRATSSYGASEQSINVIVKVKPQPPSNFNYSSLSSDKVNLFWSASPSFEVTHYRIFWVHQSLSSNGEVTLKSEEQSRQIPASGGGKRLLVEGPTSSLVGYLFTGLKPYTKYTMWVKSESINGLSSSTERIHFTTKEVAPSGPPQNVRAMAISNAAVTVSWDPPKESNGKIIAYRVYYTASPIKAIGYWRQFDHPPSANSYKTSALITHLSTNETYYIHIGARNIIGDGPVSEVYPVIARAGVLTRPRNFNAHVKSAHEVQLYWNHPDSEDALALIKHYQLDWLDLEGRQKKSIQIPPTPTEYIQGDLKPDTPYQFNITAVTSSGAGISASQSVRTREFVPGAPDQFVVKAISPTSLEVKWRAPRVQTGKVVYYRVSWLITTATGTPLSDTKRSELPVKASESDDKGWYQSLLKNLQPNTFYVVEVTAMSKAGSGDRTRSQPIKTQPNPPGIPKDLTLKVGCNPSKPCIICNWTPPSSPGINGYRVRYKIDAPDELRPSNGQSEVRERDVITSHFSTDPNEHSHGFGVTYEFQVATRGPYATSAFVSSKISLPEAAPSDSPSNFKITDSGSVSVSLAWDLPPVRYRNGKITKYEVRYFVINDEDKTDTALTIYVNSVNLNDLRENAAYACMVRAYTSVGPSPWTNPVHFGTKRKAPPPPRFIRVLRLGEERIQVTWELPETLDSEYAKFIVYWAVTDILDKRKWEHKVTKGPFTLAIIENLDPPMMYTIRVSAVGRSGIEGAWSPPVKQELIRANQQMNMVVVLGLTCRFPIGPTAISLAWEAPRIVDKLMHFRVNYTGYKQFYDVTTGRLKNLLLPEEEHSLDYKPISQFIHGLSNLSPNTRYRITVNPIFAPNASATNFPKEVICSTSKGQPPALNPPSVEYIDRVQARITLQIPRASEENGPVTHYYIVVAPTSSITTPLTPNTESDPANNNPTGLNRNTGYRNRNPSLLSLDQLKDNAQYASDKAPYLAGVFAPDNLFEKHKLSSFFVLGDTNKGNGSSVINKKLKRGIDYVASVRACVSEYCTSSPWSQPLNTNRLVTNALDPSPNRRHRKPSPQQNPSIFTYVIIGVITTLCFIAIACIAVVFLVKRRQHRRRYKTAGVNGNGSVRLSSNFHGLSSNSDPLRDNNAKEALLGPCTVLNGNGGNTGLYSPSLGGFLMHGASSPPSSGRPQSSVCVSPGPLSIQDPVEMCRMNFQSPDFPGFSLNGMVSHPPVPINRLADHVTELKANDGALFAGEYESIDPGQQFTWQQSNAEVNKSKNRYANVIAYDHSRVVIQPLDGIPGSDYINANYMDGYRKQNAYIATQGPLVETIGDFWRMIWEQRTLSIVMMTKLEERSRSKCDQYWPHRGQATYGPMTVSHIDTIELAYYTIRSFHLTRMGSMEKREIRQFQFTSWPDHGVPRHPTPLLMFLRRVRASNPPDAGPITVHCSAGVGRTGAFIVIDSMLERIKHEKTVDVYGHVTCLRSQRNYMVQTEDQYVFIHEALLEATRSGNTEVPARNLLVHLQKLSSVETGRTATGIELEFRKLNSTSKPEHGCFESANLPVNQRKNRLVNILPFEWSRVFLRPIRGLEGSDYINASHVDGYKTTGAYLACQGPLAEVCEDFWRMLWEHDSTIIVMLTSLRENGREKCHQYWPTDRSARYQYFVVDPMAEYNMAHYILREFKVTDARDGQSRTIRQFQFTEWPEQGVPSTADAFIDFIGQVHKTKDQFGQDGPITVHCSAGAGRTGVFLCLSIVLERMRYEGVVDMYQTVQMLRSQRPGMVQTEDQYQFCYTGALEYLSSFDHYAN